MDSQKDRGSRFPTYEVAIPISTAVQEKWHNGLEKVRNSFDCSSKLSTYPIGSLSCRILAVRFYHPIGEGEPVHRKRQEEVVVQAVRRAVAQSTPFELEFGRLRWTGFGGRVLAWDMPVVPEHHAIHHLVHNLLTPALVKPRGMVRLACAEKQWQLHPEVIWANDPGGRVRDTKESLRTPGDHRTKIQVDSLVVSSVMLNRPRTPLLVAQLGQSSESSAAA